MLIGIYDRHDNAVVLPLDEAAEWLKISSGTLRKVVAGESKAVKNLICVKVPSTTPIRRPETGGNRWR